ncbi:MAG TPA: M1 family aminopeptidase [Bryobacteraceae bacterium]|nr:M1 family aminopeptidase [Bryobacteraceae bacterium]
MRRLPALLLLFCPAVFAGVATDIAGAIHDTSFDRDECYRVRDLTLVREDIRIYLNDGHLIFSKPVAGRRIAALFAADVEGGDGEVLLLPPNRAERGSLARYIHSPNLDEHFHAAVFLFTGDEYDQLRAQFPNNPANKRAPEVGALLDEQWTPALRNLAANYQTQLTLDLLGSPGYPGSIFAAMLGGNRLGNFDVVYDPRASEQIFAGQAATRADRLYFDMWTSFRARSRRDHPVPPATELGLSDYRIEASVDPDLRLNVNARVKVTPSVDGMKVATFDLSPNMELSAVTVDGQPAEWLQRDSLRMNLMHGGNSMFLVVPPQPMHTGRAYEFQFRYSGRVIQNTGDRVFYVAARGDWYPTHGFQFSNYDITFRTPRDLEMAGPGDVVEDRVDGDWHVTRRRTPVPIRVAGFNLGAYRHARASRDGFVVDVYGNRGQDLALAPKEPPALPPPVPLGRSRREQQLPAVLPPMPAPDPNERLRNLASEVVSALEFMSAAFGPPALSHLTVSPIPGNFGQGFPGLLYLSTLSYIRRGTDATSASPNPDDLFFADLLHAHETAHQWWGNRVASQGYEDYWLMEALANYSAMLYLEKRGGSKSTDVLLETYRQALLRKNESGQTVDETGPIVLGLRLETSVEPRAWRTITYGKGSWIMHMLRERMGDQKFMALLAEIAHRYDHKTISTEQFRAAAATFLPPKSPDPTLGDFFDQWVYGTGIPNLSLKYSIKGKAPALRLVGTIEQTEVDNEFSALVPVEIQMPRGRTLTQWVRTGSDPVSFNVRLDQAPIKVSLDPRHWVLRR